MPPTVDIVNDADAGTWTHPSPGLRLTTTFMYIVGGGGGDGGGGGASALQTTPSVLTGDVTLQIGSGGDAHYGGNTILNDGNGAQYMFAPGGQGAYYGGTGGSYASCRGTFTIAHSGGSVGEFEGGGGGAAGPDGDGFDGGSTDGGAGGANGIYPIALKGGDGGGIGEDGSQPGGGGGGGQVGATGLFAVGYQLEDSSITGDTGTETTGSVYVAPGNSDIANMYPAGNPLPALAITGGMNAALFALNDSSPDGDGTRYGLSFLETPDNGSYLVQVTAANGMSDDFIQTVTVNVGPPFAPSILSGDFGTGHLAYAHKFTPGGSSTSTLGGFAVTGSPIPTVDTDDPSNESFFVNGPDPDSGLYSVLIWNNLANGLHTLRITLSNGNDPNFVQTLHVYVGATATTLIASVSAGGTSFGVTTTGIDTRGANLLVAAVGSSNGVTAGTFTDNASNAWTAATAYNDGTRRVQLYYCLTPVVKSGHTFTSAASGDTVSVLALHSRCGFLFDKIAGATFATVASGQPGSVTPTLDGSILITAVTTQTPNTSAQAINSGFSAPVGTVGVNGQHVNSAIAWKDQNIAAAVNPTWSWTGNFSGATTQLVFKPNPAVPTITSPASSPASIIVTEGNLAVATLAWTGDGTPTAIISGGDDAAFFSISGGNKLAFNEPQLYAAPSDLNNDRVYLVQVAVEGEFGLDTVDFEVNLDARDEIANTEAIWHCDDATGTTLTDSSTSGNSYDLTLHGAPEWTDSGKISGALILDGVDDYGVRQIPFFSESTITGWIKVSEYPSSQALLAGYLATSSEYSTILGLDSSGHLIGYCYDGASRRAAGSTALAIDVWYFFAITFKNGSAIKLFVDAVQDGAVAIGTQYHAWSTGPFFRIGGATSGTGAAAFQNYANVVFDELRLHSRALTVQELQSLYAYPNFALPQIFAPTSSSSFAITIIENTTAVTQVQWGGDGTITASLTGDDAAKFNLDGSGNLAFKVAPTVASPGDLDTNNVYLVGVHLASQFGTDQLDLQITVASSATLPVVFGPDMVLWKLEQSDPFVALASATGAPTPTLSLTGADASLFKLDNTHGQGNLSFDLTKFPVGQIEYDDPQDTGHENVYHVTVSFTNAAGTVSKQFTITITPKPRATSTASILLLTKALQ